MGFLPPLVILSVALTTFYLFVHCALAIGLRRSQRFERNSNRPFVSVIVAARNEEDNLERLLEQLVRQSFRSYEVLVVNDRSTDRTPSIVDSFVRRYPLIRGIDIVSVPEGMPAKKHALSKGIECSKGEILCFTDADCVPGTRWVEELVSCFDATVGIVAGYSPYDTRLLSLAQVERSTRNPFRKLFFGFVNYEEFRGGVWSAGSIGLRKGWLCTGRNLAYRRKVYDEVGGFESIRMSISGDDDLFLQLVRRTTSWRVRYVLTPESFVATAPPPTPGDFVRQRVRHFSAGRYFSIPMKLFFLLYHGANLLCVVSCIYFAVLGAIEAALAPLALKLAADSLLFFTASGPFSARRFMAGFIPLEFLYIVYNTFIGPLGFLRKIQW